MSEALIYLNAKFYLMFYFSSDELSGAHSKAITKAMI